MNRVAALMGVAPQTIYRWEKGLMEPGARALFALSAVLCVSMDELMGARGSAAPLDED